MRSSSVSSSGATTDVEDPATGKTYDVIADDERRFYGTMFHPEVAHTPHGAQLLRNFAQGVCGCRGDWTMAGFRAEAIERIRAQVGDGRVVCGLSAGVDSSVAAVLLHEAQPDQHEHHRRDDLRDLRDHRTPA